MANRAQKYIEGLILRGFSPAQAAALAGNIQTESAGDPNAYNPDEGAYGLMQWRLDRKTGLGNYAKSTGRDPSDPEAQMDWLAVEMTGPEAKNAKAFLSAQDPAAASAALKSYIRYANGSETARLNNTLSFAQGYGQQGTSNMQAAAKPDRQSFLSAWGGASATPGAAPVSKEQFLQQWDTKGQDTATPKADRQQFLDAWNSAGGPPSGAKPGSKEYTQWAVGQAKAGKSLGIPTSLPPEEYALWYATHVKDGKFEGKDAPAPTVDLGLTSPEAKIQAGITSAWNAVPIAGPFISGKLNEAKAAIHGTTPEAVADEAALLQQLNPVSSGAGAVAGTVLPLLAASAPATGAKLLGVTGSTLSRMGYGLATGGTIAGVDTLARGGSKDDAFINALIGGGLGAALPGAGRLAGDAWRGIRGPAAAEAFVKALGADAIPAGSVNKLIGDLGPGAVAADLGPNMQMLAGGLTALPGQAQTTIKNALMNRAKAAGSRLATDIADNLGVNAPLGQITQRIVDAQRAAAAPLYESVRNVRLPIDGDLKFVLQTPMGQKAFRQAADLMANDGIRVNGLTVGLVDYAKQALDDIASSSIRSGEKNLARQATQLADKLKKGADAFAPDYAKAREAFAGPARVLDAIEEGQSVFTKNMTPEALKDLMSTMTASEKEGVLLGAQNAVQELIGNARNDALAVRNAFKANFSKEKLAMLIGDDAAENIFKAIEREAKFGETSHVAYGNSLTAAREEMKKLVSPETNPIATKPQSWTGLFFNAIERARNSLTASYRQGQNAKLANMLTQGALSDAQIASLASTDARNALLAPAAIPLLDKNNPGGGMLKWRGPQGNMLLSDLPATAVR